MESRITLIPSETMTAIPAALPPDLAEDALTGKLEAGVFEFNDKYQNIHLILEAQTAYSDPIALVAISIFGYINATQAPVLIASPVVNNDDAPRPGRCDVPLPCSFLGYQFLYVQQTGGTLCNFQIAHESRWSI